MNIKYVLENVISQRQCSLCGALWFIFDNGNKTNGVFRLGDDAPEKCLMCKPVDEQVIKDSLYNVERWVSGDENE